MQHTSFKKLIFTGLSIAVLSIFLHPQNANARPSTRAFTCEAVRDFVHDRGAVVMNTKNRSVYRRFVDNRSFCYARETTKRFTVPTRNGRCSLKICAEYENFRSFGRD